MSCGAHGCCDAHQPYNGPLGKNLFEKIDTNKLVCYNESVDGSGRRVFRPLIETRADTEFVESDEDPELLFIVPFTGLVKIQSVVVVGGEGGHHPTSVKLFKNRPDMDLSSVPSTADQQLSLCHDSDGILQYPVMPARFGSVSSLAMYFPESGGSKTTRIHHIQINGEFLTGFGKAPNTVLLYEAQANPADHKLYHFESNRHQIM